MEQFEISNKPFRNGVYRRLNSILIKLNSFVQKRIKESEVLVINPISVKLPTPFCVIIRFSIINRNEKYELVLQGDWRDWYTDYTSNLDKEGYIPSDMKLEMIIRYHFKSAYKINNNQNREAL